MWIDNVTNIRVKDEEYIAIEVGTTLNCKEILVSRECDIKVMPHPYARSGEECVIAVVDMVDLDQKYIA
jgi:hypothetical protein